MKDQMESFISQFQQMMPGGAYSQELEKNLRALMNSTFEKMNLVTREEFDAQAAVLAKTREKIDQLEQQLDELLAKTK